MCVWIQACGPVPNIQACGPVPNIQACGRVPNIQACGPVPNNFQPYLTAYNLPRTPQMSVCGRVAALHAVCKQVTLCALTVFGRRWALRCVRPEMVARVGVLVHWRERVGPQCGARAAEPRWIHGRMMVTRRAPAGLGSSLVEVVCRRVVVLAVSCRSCRRPDGVVRHPGVLLQLDKSGLVHTSHTSSGVRHRRAIGGRRRILMRRRRQTSTAR